VSTGHASHNFVSCLRSLNPENHKIVALAARNKATAEEFSSKHHISRSYGSYEELAADRDVEVAYIGNLHPWHLHVGKLMLEAGKHVVIEKPLAMNPGEVRELITLAQHKRLFLLEAVWSRFFPVYGKLRRMIESGTVGDVKGVFVTNGSDMRHVHRVQDRTLGGGAILDIGVYAVQFVTHIFKDEEPLSVVTAGHLNDTGADVVSNTSMLFSDNKMANIVLSAERDLDNCAYVVGTSGTIKICAPYAAPTKIEALVGKIEYPLPKVKLPLHYPNSAGLCYQAEEVRRCLQAGLLESEHMTHKDSVRVSTIMDSMLQQLGVKYPHF